MRLSNRMARIVARIALASLFVAGLLSHSLAVGHRSVSGDEPSLETPTPPSTSTPTSTSPTPSTLTTPTPNQVQGVTTPTQSPSNPLTTTTPTVNESHHDEQPTSPTPQAPTASAVTSTETHPTAHSDASHSDEHSPTPPAPTPSQPHELAQALASIPPPPPPLVPDSSHPHPHREHGHTKRHSSSASQLSETDLEIDDDEEEEELAAAAAAAAVAAGGNVIGLPSSHPLHTHPLLTSAEVARIASDMAKHEDHPSVQALGQPPRVTTQASNRPKPPPVHPPPLTVTPPPPQPTTTPTLIIPPSTSTPPPPPPPLPSVVPLETSPSPTNDQDLRSTARALLRRMAAERVAAAERAVQAAMQEKARFATAKEHEPAAVATVSTPAPTSVSDSLDKALDPIVVGPNHLDHQNLFSIDHTDDDEPDDDAGRDKALLRYAMDQMAAESRRKQDEITRLLAALNHGHPLSGTSNSLSALDRIDTNQPTTVEKELERLRGELEQQHATSFNYTLWILLGIGVLCLCIAIPVVWIYWLRTWFLTYAESRSLPTAAYRSINAAANEVVVADDEIYDDDELPVDSPHARVSSQIRSIRFDSRYPTATKQSRSFGVRSSGAPFSSSSAASAAASRHSFNRPATTRSHSSAASTRTPVMSPRDLPDFDEEVGDVDFSRRSERPPAGPRPRVEDLEDEDDNDEEAYIIATAAAAGSPRR